MKIGSSQNTSQDLTCQAGTCLLGRRGPGSDIVGSTCSSAPTKTFKQPLDDLFFLEKILVGDTPRNFKHKISVALRVEGQRCHDHSSIVSLCLNFLPARSAARNMNWFPYNSNWMFGTCRTVCTVSVVSDEAGGGSGRGVLISWDGDNVE